MAADLDGDGKTEMLLVKEGQIYVYSLNQNNGLVQSWLISDSRIKSEFPLLIGDYNGDGKADIMIPTANNSGLFALFLSTGTGSVKSEITYPFSYRVDQTGSTTNTYNLIPIDVDGDGKTDIIDYQTLTFTNSDNGTQVLAPFYNTAPTTVDGKPAFSAGSTVTRTGNLRHFPIPIFLPSDKPNVNLEFASASHQWVTYFQFKRDHREEGLLRSVSSGGVQELIDYRSLSSGTVHPTENIPIYSHGSTQIFPYVDIVEAQPLKIVQGISRIVNGLTIDQQYFSYKAAVIHQQGLGFLGFEGVASSNRHIQAGDRIFSVTISDPQLRGAPIQQHSQLQFPSFVQNVSGYISKTTNSYEGELLPNKVYKLRNTVSQTHNALEGTTVTNQTQYDVYNNPVSITTNYPGVGSVSESLTYSHSTGSPYFIGRPASRSETRTIIGEPSFTTTEEWSYNSAGLVSQRRKKGNNIANFDKEDFTYDVYGNLLSYTVLPYGTATARTVIYEYDPTNRFLAKKTDVDGLSTHYVYNPVSGSLLSETNPFNQTSSFSYDGWGGLTTTTDIYDKQTTTAFSKDPANQHLIVEKSSQSGASSVKEFDALKRLIREGNKDALGQWSFVKQEYDIQGRPWRKSEPYSGTAPSHWTTTLYDVYGRPISITEPTGKVTTMSYTGLSVTVSDGTKTTVTNKNALGLIISQQDPGGTIHYSYFSNGNTKTADYGGSVQTIEQDGWGRKTRLIDPSAGEYLYEYNAWGELSKETSPKGNTIYQYDALGRLTEKNVSGDATTGSSPTNMQSTYSYEAGTGLLSQISLINADGNNSTYTYTYDSWKRPQTITEIKPSVQFTRSFSYDSFGRVLTETSDAQVISSGHSTNRTLHYTYQNGGVLRMRDGTVSGAILWELQGLNARGQVTQLGLGSNGMLQQKSYDVYGLPEQQKMVKSGVEKFSHNYTWNARQTLLTGRSTTLFMHNAQPWTESFLYDGQERLTQWTDPLTAMTQTYDARGRIENNGAAGNYIYSNNTSYRQKEIILNTAGQNYYQGRELQQIVYNNFKQPVEILEENRDKISFQYNADGQRSSMAWGRAVLAGGNWGTARYNSHYSADGSMEITVDVQSATTTFVLYLGGDAYSAPLVWRSVQGTGGGQEFLYLHRDHLGSIVAITDGQGLIAVFPVGRLAPAVTM